MAGTEPLAGMTIHYNHHKAAQDLACINSDVSVVTDSSGQFLFEEVKVFEPFFVMGDRVFQYEICLEKDGQQLLLLSKFDFGVLGPSLEISCDSNAQAVSSYDGASKGRCSVSEQVQKQ